MRLILEQSPSWFSPSVDLALQACKRLKDTILYERRKSKALQIHFLYPNGQSNCFIVYIADALYYSHQVCHPYVPSTNSRSKSQLCKPTAVNRSVTTNCSYSRQLLSFPLCGRVSLSHRYNLQSSLIPGSPNGKSKSQSMPTYFKDLLLPTIYTIFAISFFLLSFNYILLVGIYLLIQSSRVKDMVWRYYCSYLEILLLVSIYFYLYYKSLHNLYLSFSTQSSKAKQIKSSQTIRDVYRISCKKV